MLGVLFLSPSLGDWQSAASWLIKSSLGGEEASVALSDDSSLHGDGSISGWGCWAERDGNGVLEVEVIGSQTSFSVGVVTDKVKGAHGAGGFRKLFVDVVADATLGPSKVGCRPADASLAGGGGATLTGRCLCISRRCCPYFVTRSLSPPPPHTHFPLYSVALLSDTHHHCIEPARWFV